MNNFPQSEARIAKDGPTGVPVGAAARDKNIWVVITAYQEAQTIAEVVRGALLQSANVVIVDDGSTDDTLREAHNAGAYVLRHLFNLGQGAALQTGLTFALSEGADLIVTMDADGQHNPADITRMAEKMAEAGADVALGNRFSGEAIGISWRRRFILKCAWIVIWLTSGVAVADSQIGLRIFSAEAARKLAITQHRMAYASELIQQIHRLNLKTVDVPVTVTYTDYSIKKGQSGFNSINIIIDLILGKFAK